MFSSALGRMWRGHRTEEQTLGPSPRRACPRGALIQAGLSRSRRAGHAAPCKAAWAQLGQTETRKEERAPSRHLPPPLHAPQWRWGFPMPGTHPQWAAALNTPTGCRLLGGRQGPGLWVIGQCPGRLLQGLELRHCVGLQLKGLSLRQEVKRHDLGRGQVRGCIQLLLGLR